MQRTSRRAFSKQLRRAVYIVSASAPTLALGGCGIDGRVPDTIDSTSPTMLRGVVPVLPGGSGEGPSEAMETVLDAAAPPPDVPDVPEETAAASDAGFDDEAPEPPPEPALPRDPLLTQFSPTRLPSEEPDCLVSSRRIPGKDGAHSVFLGIGYFGWAEWMEGTWGTCEGTQWLRFHLQIDLPAPLEIRYLVSDGTPTAVGYAWPDGLAGRLNSTDAEVIHDGPLLRDSRVICALMSLPEQPRGEWPVFGFYEQQLPLQNAISGILC